MTAPAERAEVVRVERLIAAALAFTGVCEHGGNNHGEMVELFLHGVGLAAGAPWCAAFVHHVGYWSQYDPARRSSTWPLPATGACQVLAEAAGRRGVLTETPVRGGVFLLWAPSLGRFAHTGIVLEPQCVPDAVGGWRCTTIEGNTGEDGSREGWTTAIRERVFARGDGHRFVDWAGIGAAGPAREGA